MWSGVRCSVEIILASTVDRIFRRQSVSDDMFNRSYTFINTSNYMKCELCVEALLVTILCAHTYSALLLYHVKMKNGSCYYSGIDFLVFCQMDEMDIFQKQVSICGHFRFCFVGCKKEQVSSGVLLFAAASSAKETNICFPGDRRDIQRNLNSTFRSMFGHTRTYYERRNSSSSGILNTSCQRGNEFSPPPCLTAEAPTETIRAYC